MSTAAIARRLIELCEAGEFIQAQHELYDTNIKRIDPDGTASEGASNMHAKERLFLDSLEKIHSIRFSDPLIAGNYFTVRLIMEIEIKNIGNRHIEEICVYQVAGGRIVFEQFFRDM